ncbi:hypothetical protein CspHIS471_0701750 [Cutaneotrichosporon sp. HIS471]|nr:hypothetical protein CspHIS471_0701750 [Cutaneotrichosporon sp. HIS471]
MLPWREFGKEKDVAFGSDVPTAPYHTLPNVHTAVTHLPAIEPDRQDPTDTRTQALAKLCVSILTAPLETSIRYYMVGGALWVSADDIGSLEHRKATDFCVHPVDPFKDGTGVLRNAKKAVFETGVSGEEDWKKDA